MAFSRQVAIVGVDECDEIGRVPNKSALMLHAEAVRNALNDAGLSLSDVDGILSTTNTLDLAEYLGITAPNFTDCTSVFGSSFIIHVEHAAAAIQEGICEVAVVSHGATGHSNRYRTYVRPAVDPSAMAYQFQNPYGPTAAPGGYSIACSRHMQEYGTTHEQLGEIAVATRKWAQLNPKALMRDPMTMEDYLNSRWVAWPFHLLDCCLVTDAGGAVVVTSLERARSLKKKPVLVLGAGESHTHSMISQMPSLTSMAAKISGANAFKMAGVTHDDIDVVNVYDSFTYTALLTLEDLGFCKPGEGGDFVSGQRTAPGGDFPMNTNGGGLSYTHPGAYGIFPMIEVVRQLRGECGERQVEGAKIGLCHGTGGTLSSGGTVILGVE